MITKFNRHYVMVAVVAALAGVGGVARGALVSDTFAFGWKPGSLDNYSLSGAKMAITTLRQNGASTVEVPDNQISEITVDETKGYQAGLITIQAVGNQGWLKFAGLDSQDGGYTVMADMCYNDYVHKIDNKLSMQVSYKDAPNKAGDGRVVVREKGYIDLEQEFDYVSQQSVLQFTYEGTLRIWGDIAQTQLLGKQTYSETILVNTSSYRTNWEFASFSVEPSLASASYVITFDSRISAKTASDTTNQIFDCPRAFMSKTETAIGFVVPEAPVGDPIPEPASLGLLGLGAIGLLLRSRR